MKLPHLLRPLVLGPWSLVLLLALVLPVAFAQPATVLADPTTGTLFRPNANAFVSANGLLTDATAELTYQPLSANLTSWAALTRASGYDTFTATPSSANLASLVTGETGSGALVFGTSPTLTTPTLGVASGTSLTLSSLTSGRVTFATTSGLLTDDADLTFATDTLTATKGTFGGITHISNAIAAVNSLTAAAGNALTLTGGDSGASLVLGAGSGGSASIVPASSGNVILRNAGGGTLNSIFQFGVSPDEDGRIIANGSSLTIRSASARPLIFGAGGAEVARLVNSTGNLLIGTTSDDALGTTRSKISAFSASGAALDLTNNSTTADANQGTVFFGTTGASSGKQGAAIQSRNSGTITTQASSYLQFFTNAGSGLAEVMRISPLQNLLIGTTTDITGTGGLHVAGTTAASSSTLGGALRVGSNVAISGNAGGASYFGGSIKLTTTGTSFFLPTQSVDTPQWTNDAANTYFDYNGTFRLRGLAAGVATSNLTITAAGAATFAGAVTTTGTFTQISPASASPALAEFRHPYTGGTSDPYIAIGSFANTSTGARIVANVFYAGDIGAGLTFQTRTNVGVLQDSLILAKNTGAATFAGAVTANGQLIAKGTATNDSAATGYIGEYVSSTVAVGSAVSLTNNTVTQLTSISLTAGDWDVSGVVAFTVAGTTTITSLVGGISTSSSGFSNDYGRFDVPGFGLTTTLAPRNAVPTQRVSIAGTTTLYLLAYSTFGVSTNAAWGIIAARRVR